MTDGNFASPNPSSSFTSPYSALKYQMKEAGLLERQPLYYLSKLLLLLALLASSITLLLLVSSFGFQLLNAVFLAFITTQLGLLAHAAGHRQIFRNTQKNTLVGLLMGNMLVGLSLAWWVERHNKHHSHPNQHDVDPDVFIPVVAFAPEDLQGKNPFLLNLMKYQAYYFFPLLSLALVEMHVRSLQFLLKQKLSSTFVEWFLLTLHYVLYLGLFFSHFVIWQAIVLIVLHHLFTGIYMGSVFAPNHKGMPVLEKKSQMDFLHRQILTARNVHAHPLTDFWYGGLNYQIEHHLFPSMAQNHLREAQLLVKAFCRKHALSYYETNLWQSYRETVLALHQVTAPLRRASVHP